MSAAVSALIVSSPRLGGRVDADEVVVLEDRLEGLLQRALAADHRRHRDLRAGEVDRGAGDVDLALADHLADRDLVHEHVVHRLLERVGVDALGHRQVALRVHVDAQHPVALLRERGGEVERRRRLGHAALLVGERDDLGLSFHGGSDARLSGKPSGGYSHGGGRFLHGELRSRAMAAAEQRQARRRCAARLTRQARAGLRRRGRRGQDDDLGGARARAGRARAEGGGRHDRPGQAPGRGAGPAAALRRAAAGSTRRCSRRRASRCKGELWAMMLDAKRTFDEIVDAPGARRARARGDPRQPDLPRALHRRGRLAGAQRGRQAVRAATRSTTST